MLLPHSNTTSSDIGSGIAAVKSNNAISDSSSHLVFITDEPNGTSQEQMRISDIGFVGINNTNPQAELHVNGTAIIEKTLTVNNGIYTAKLEGLNSSLVISPNSTWRIDGSVSANNRLTVGNGVYLQPIQNQISALSNYGGLYVDKKDNNALYYVRDDNQRFKISGRFSGEPNGIAFFNDQGILDSEPSILVNNGSINIGQNASNVSVNLSVSVNTSIQADLAAQRIDMQFTDRTSVGTARKFTGMDISFDNAPGHTGRLAQNDIAVGLNIDVSNLQAAQSSKSQVGSDVVYQGKKYAATFMGGSVGIGTKTPDALLHINATGSKDILTIGSNDPVSGQSTENILVINKNGFIGMGTKAPKSQLEIQKYSTLLPHTPIFQISDSSNRSLFMVTGNGNIGIATANPTHQLEVNGSLFSSKLTTNELAFKQATINNNIFITSANISMGRKDLSAGIALYATLNAQSSGDFIGTSYQLNLVGGKTNNPLYIDQDIIASDIQLTQDQSTSLQNSNITGINIDASELKLDSTQKSYVTGLNIDVSGSGANRYAALFNGGQVAINLPTENLQATHSLSVSGNILANNILTNSELELIAATFNVNNLNVYGSLSSKQHISGKSFKFNSLLPSERTDLLSNHPFGNALLYLNGDNDLIYRFPKALSTDPTKEANLTKAFVGTANYIPFYNQNGSLSTSKNLQFANSKLQIGSNDSSATLKVNSTIANTETDFKSEDITLSIEDRNSSSASNGTFYGSKITLKGTGTRPALLGPNDTAVGLFVDMSDLTAKQSDGRNPGTGYTGYKYGAAFMGGNVGIGTDEPEADLHIKGSSVNDYILNVDANANTGIATENIFVIANNGYTGMGTDKPEAQLHLKSYDNDPTKTLTRIDTTAGDSIFQIRNDGNIGMGNIDTLTDIDSQLVIKGSVIMKDSTNTKFFSTSGTNIAIGNITPVSDVNLAIESNDTKTSLLVHDGVQTNPTFIIDNDKVGIKTSKDKLRADLTVSGNILIGDEDARVAVLSPTDYGITSASDSSFLFTGIKNDTPTILFSGNKVLRFNQIATLNNTGQLSINTKNITAQLNIEGSSGLPIADIRNHENKKAFNIDKNGNVAIGNGDPETYANSTKYNLSVHGNLIAEEIKTTKLTATTIQSTSNFNISKTLSTDQAETISSIEGSLGVAITNPLTGLDIKLESLTAAAGKDPHTIYNADAIGLKVDLSALQTNDGTNFLNGNIGANRIAGLFQGGAVGIGLSGASTVKAPLHVKSTMQDTYKNYNLARFDSQDTSLLLKGYTDGVGFLVQESTGIIENITFVMNNNGRVGIGTNPKEAKDLSNALTVNGDIQMGIKNTAVYGDKLIFSGHQASKPSYINAHSSDANTSQLNLLSSTGKIIFGQGNKDNDTITNPFTIETYGTTNTARIGINTTSPGTQLHIVSDKSGSGDAPTEYPVLIQSKASSQGTGLAVAISKPSNANPTTNDKYITFFNSTVEAGGIRGSGAMHSFIQKVLTMQST